jgi:hypothetical protein
MLTDRGSFIHCLAKNRRASEALANVADGSSEALLGAQLIVRL